MCVGDKGAPGFEGLVGVDGDKVSIKLLFYSIINVPIIDLSFSKAVYQNTNKKNEFYQIQNIQIDIHIII